MRKTVVILFTTATPAARDHSRGYLSFPSPSLIESESARSSLWVIRRNLDSTRKSSSASLASPTWFQIGCPGMYRSRLRVMAARASSLIGSRYQTMRYYCDRHASQRRFGSCTEISQEGASAPPSERGIPQSRVRTTGTGSPIEER